MDLKKNILTKIASKEAVSLKSLESMIKAGKVVVPANINHKNLEPIGIGKSLSTKVNVNIGSSPQVKSLKNELKKLELTLKYKGDTIMDLSIGGDIDRFRKAIIENSPIPVGTVPVYQAAADAGSLQKLEKQHFLDAIEKHCFDGVDFITVHCGITQSILPKLEDRLTGVVSRGGSMLVKWMKLHNQENPLYEYYDDILEIAKKYNVTLSLGDGLRPGSIYDATDVAQLSELKKLGELTKKAWEKDVQVMIEGPGHVPLNQIKENIELQKKYCFEAPFYILGPVVTDIAPGYDHITAAIGGALGGMYGADFLCYVTPAEHLRLPTTNDVKEGIIATRIAAHAADIAKGNVNALNWDNEMSKYRKKLDWAKQIALSIDPEKAAKYRKESKACGKECTMCGKWCAMI